MTTRDIYMQTEAGDVFTTSHPEYHKECKQLPRTEGDRLYRAQMLAQLKKTVKPGSTVYTSVRSVSASGMSRRMRVYIVTKDRKIADISYTVATLTKNTLKDGDVVMSGVGMDMGFALVYELGCAMWPKGTPKPHGTRNGTPDKAGGYALKQSWL